MIFKRTELLEALSALSHAAPTRAAIPILGNVIIDGGCLTATNLEIRHTINVSIEDDAIFTTTIPLRTLLAIVKQSESEQIEITQSNNTALIAAGSARYTVQTLPPDDSMNPKDKVATKEFTVDTAELKRVIKAVRHCTSVDPAKYALNGVLVEFQKEGSFGAAACSGSTLAHLNTEKEPEFKAIIHNSSISSILTLDDDDESRVTFSEGTIAIRQKRQRIRAKLVEGRFPNWRSVIPVISGMNTTEVNVKSLMTTIGRSAVALGETLAMEISPDLDPDSVVLRKDGFEEGIDCKHSGKPITVKINANYLQKALSVIGSEEATIMTLEGATVVIKGGENDPTQVIATMGVPK